MSQAQIVLKYAVVVVVALVLVFKCELIGKEI